jgi:hypothetical protein
MNDMKTIITLLLISVSIASAQTSTNATPIIINFTNTLGEFITNATVVSVSANKLIYRTQDGIGGGVIRLDKLSPELQARLNYNPQVALQADYADADKKSAQEQYWQHQRELADQQAQVAQLVSNREKMQKHATKIEGRVIQTLDNGVLISCFSSVERSFFPDEIYKSWENKNLLGTLDEAENIVFLVDYPFKNRLAADDKLATVAYPDGFFKYSTVNHSENTVRRYTSSIDRAVTDWQPNSINGKIYP